jgi:hypothetical protein
VSPHVAAFLAVPGKNVLRFLLEDVSLSRSGGIIYQKKFGATRFSCGFFDEERRVDRRGKMTAMSWVG